MAANRRSVARKPTISTRRSSRWPRSAPSPSFSATSTSNCLATRPKFVESHKHKDAGMRETIAMGCQPMPYPEPPEGTTLVDRGDVPFPPSDADGPVTVVHVLRFEDAQAIFRRHDGAESVAG